TEAGWSNWEAFTASAAQRTPPPGEPFAINARDASIRPRRNLSSHDWDALLAAMHERRLNTLDVGGQITDAVLARVAELHHATRLNLAGSRALTAAGLAHLARMPQLEHLDLSGANITDEGLEVLQHLPNLRHFEMTWQRGV